MAYLFNYLYDVSGHEKAQRHYYTFGWSGLLSAQSRYQDAKLFFDQLTAEVSQFKQQGITPKITIFGYSHGGNVSLNLAAIRRDFYGTFPFVVDELVLIGVPIQQQTDYLITDPMFKSIDNWYSKADRIQPLDLFSSKGLFSKRVFSGRRKFKLPDKLRQIEVRVTRCNARVAKSPKTRLLATNLKYPGILSGTSPLLRSMSPGHAELWFFGWTPVNYRQNFSLNPLPAICVMPFMSRYLNTAKEGNTHHLIADIRPEGGMVVIKNPQKTGYDTTKFLTPEQFAHISGQLKNLAPKEYTQKIYEARIMKAYHQAQAEKRASLIKRKRGRHKIASKQPSSQALATAT